MHDGMGQLEDAWARGTLHRPDWSTPHFLDLIWALAHQAGVPETPTAHAAALAERIGPADHLIFVWVDALGLNALQRLPADSFLRAHCVQPLQALYPATTSCATISMATGAWPTRHGMLGWWLYLDEFHLSTTVLRFEERASRRPLSEWGVTPADLWPLPVLADRIPRDLLTLQPAAFWDSPCSRYQRGTRTGAGYVQLDAAVECIVERIRRADGPTYTYFYVPHLDSAGHEHGMASPQALAALTEIDACLAQLAGALAGRARLVITADHGQVDVPETHRLPLYAGDPLLAHLLAPPTGGKRTGLYHVRSGHGDAFAAAFRERFGEHFALISADQADDLRLFGPEPCVPLARRRLGDFVSIALCDVTLSFLRPGDTPADANVGNHDGMSPAEMRIPLILA